jgi:hypothetical protein
MTTRIDWICSLPSHLWVTILFEWVGDFVDIGFLDMAICNREARAIFLESLRVDVLSNVDIIDSVAELQWLINRHISVRQFSIDITKQEIIDLLSRQFSLRNNLRNLQTLEISFDECGDDMSLTSLEQYFENDLPSLQSLSLLCPFGGQPSPIKNFKRRVITKGNSVPTLKILRLDGREFRNWRPLFQDQVFQRFPNLIELEINDTVITDLQVLQILELLPLLETISISQNARSETLNDLEFDLNDFKNKPKFVNLKKLTFGRQMKRSFFIDAIEEMDGFPDLMSLPNGSSVLLGVIAQRAPNLKECEISTGNYHLANFQLLKEHCPQLETFEYIIDFEYSANSNLVSSAFFMPIGLNLLFLENGCENLKILSLTNRSTLEIGLGFMVFEYSCFQTLKELRLDNIAFHSLLPVIFAQLFLNLPQLEIFDWSQFQCSDELLNAAFPEDFLLSNQTPSSSSSLRELSLQSSRSWNSDDDDTFQLQNVSKLLNIIQHLYPQLKKLRLEFPNLEDHHLIQILTFYGPKQLELFSFDCKRKRSSRDMFIPTPEFKEALIACQSLQSLKIRGYYSIGNCSFLEECLLATSPVLKEFKIYDRLLQETWDKFDPVNNDNSEINAEEEGKVTEQTESEVISDSKEEVAVEEEEGENIFVSMEKNLQNRPCGILYFIYESEF